MIREDASAATALSSLMLVTYGGAARTAHRASPTRAAVALSAALTACSKPSLWRLRPLRCSDRDHTLHVP
jgi:hypothetical protein